MKISINILTWNNKETIIDLLNNVKGDVADIEHEYIFIDNNSNDGTLDLISDWIVRNLANNFSFVRNSENLGISKGKNQGIDLSEGDYILMLDGDVMPVPNTIRLMAKWLDENKDKHAIGMYPNKFALEQNKGGQVHHEEYCKDLYKPVKFKCCCLYYGMFRRSIFKKGLRMNEKGEFGKPGYGWEDHDFYKRMQKAKVDQYVAHINNEKGKYYHKINSSIRAMGHEKYKETSVIRNKQFKKEWDNGSGQGSRKSS